MTNKDHWNNYTSSVCSPQNFIEWSIRSVISCALQRRVSINGCPKYGHFPLFPNTYTLLVGPAAAGKGVIIGPSIELLRYHKQKDFLSNQDTLTTTDEEKLVTQKLLQANTEDAEATMQKLKRGGEKIDAPLFPSAPDATTYEALVEAMGDSFRRINFTRENEEGKKILEIYGHCSMYFTLPELASLMRKRTDDTVNYLLGLYDCPLDYEYKTKTQGRDRVRRGCLNILAGTTPEFMETIFDQQLIDQGFSSRVFFIFGAKNRKHIGLPEPLTKDQMDSKKILLSHVKKLAGICGEVVLTKDTRAKFNQWWHDHQEAAVECSPKLLPFKGRMNIHVLKVAMQEHFLESTALELSWEDIERAIEIVKQEMKTMHLAMTFESDNPEAKVTDKIEKYILSRKTTSLVDLLGEFWKQLPRGRKSLEDILVQLISTKRIVEDREEEPVTKKEKIVYKAS